MRPVRLKIYRMALMTRRTFLMMQACGAVLVTLIFIGTLTVLTPDNAAIQELTKDIPYLDSAMRFLPWIVLLTACYETYQTVKILREFRTTEQAWQSRVGQPIETVNETTLNPEEAQSQNLQSSAAH